MWALEEKQKRKDKERKKKAKKEKRKAKKKAKLSELITSGMSYEQAVNAIECLATRRNRTLTRLHLDVFVVGNHHGPADQRAYGSPPGLRSGSRVAEHDA